MSAPLPSSPAAVLFSALCADRLAVHLAGCTVCVVRRAELRNPWSIESVMLCGVGRELRAWHIRNQVPAGVCAPECAGGPVCRARLEARP